MLAKLHFAWTGPAQPAHHIPNPRALQHLIVDLPPAREPLDGQARARDFSLGNRPLAHYARQLEAYPGQAEAMITIIEHCLTAATLLRLVPHTNGSAEIFPSPVLDLDLDHDTADRLFSALKRPRKRLLIREAILNLEQTGHHNMAQELRQRTTRLDILSRTLAPPRQLTLAPTPNHEKRSSPLPA